MTLYEVFDWLELSAVTPHTSAVTLAHSCAVQIAENYRRMKAGQPLLNAVDPAREY